MYLVRTNIGYYYMNERHSISNDEIPTGLEQHDLPGSADNYSMPEKYEQTIKSLDDARNILLSIETALTARIGSERQQEKKAYLREDVRLMNHQLFILATLIASFNKEKEDLTKNRRIKQKRTTEFQQKFVSLTKSLLVNAYEKWINPSTQEEASTDYPKEEITKLKSYCGTLATTRKIITDSDGKANQLLENMKQKEKEIRKEHIPGTIVFIEKMLIGHSIILTPEQATDLEALKKNYTQKDLCTSQVAKQTVHTPPSQGAIGSAIHQEISQDGSRAYSALGGSSANQLGIAGGSAKTVVPLSPWNPMNPVGITRRTHETASALTNQPDTRSPHTYEKDTDYTSYKEDPKKQTYVTAASATATQPDTRLPHTYSSKDDDFTHYQKSPFDANGGTILGRNDLLETSWVQREGSGDLGKKDEEERSSDCIQNTF